MWNNSNLEIVQGDYTQQTQVFGKRFNLVLTNPPYVRHHHLSPKDKRRLQARIAEELGLSISGLAGLYVHFLLLTHQWMEEGGIGIWLIPSEFTNVNYGIAVQRYLTEHVRLLHIHRFCPADAQFCDAMVTSSIVVFQKSRPAATNTTRFTLGGSMQHPQLEDHISLVTLHGQTKWTSFPQRPDNRLHTSPHTVRLGQLFSIKRGIATGSNRFFILPRSKAHALGIPDCVLRPILPSPRYLPELVVERDPDGWPIVDEPLALIDSVMDEATVRKKHPRFWAYLRSGIEQGLNQRYLTSRRSPWYSQEHRPPAPFLCTYMGRSRNGSNPFRFIWNKSDATAANVYLLLYPKGELRACLNEYPNLTGAVFEGLRQIEPDSFITEGRVYGGGLHKLEPKELAALSGQPIVTRIAGVSPHSQLRFAW